MPLIENPIIASVVLFFLVVVIPVWIIDIVQIGLGLKLAFTFAGAAGIWLSLSMGTLRGKN